MRHNHLILLCRKNSISEDGPQWMTCWMSGESCRYCSNNNSKAPLWIAKGLDYFLFDVFSWHFVYMSTNLTLAIRWDFQEVQWNYHQDNVEIAGTSCYTPHTFGKTLLFWAFLFGVHVMNLQDRSQIPQLKYCFQHNKLYFPCGEIQTWWRDAPCTT